MKPIALTGDPVAQDAVAMQLTLLITDQQLRASVLIGVMTRAEAYQVHHDGGEVWQCGPYTPARDLTGLIDRVLPGTTFAEIAPQVVSALREMSSKTNLTGEPA